MREFELQLDLTNNFTIGGFIYPVIKNKLEIGTCKFNSKNDRIIGFFSLNHDVEKEQYLNYNTNIKDGKHWLVNIELSDRETKVSVQSIYPVK